MAIPGAFPGPSAEFVAFVMHEQMRWSEVVQKVAIKAD